MSLKKYRILSLDISSTSTGWSFYSGDFNKLKFGRIKPDKKLETAEKLNYFRKELVKIVNRLKPNSIVIEDTFFGRNAKVSKLLAKFAGVAEQVILEHCRTCPDIIVNTVVKSFFKAYNKENLYYIIIDVMNFDENSFNYKEHNDITDSIAQLLFYYDNVLNIKMLRFDKEYGYLYEIV
jgi:Holliday junction resolvasome RuvABC endonuclease subunit